MTPALARLLRVYGVIALLAAVVLGLLPELSHASIRPQSELRVPWYVLTVLFALVEVYVLHVQVRREAQTVSLCEIPLALGLFFTAPLPLLLARVAGPLLVFIFVRRQAPMKVIYNSVLLLANCSLAIVIFRALGGEAGPSAPTAWAATLAAVAGAGVLDAVATTLVIAAYEGTLRPRDLLREPLVEAARAMAVAVIALVAVFALAFDVRSALPLAAVGGILLLGYRAYAQLNDRHLSLERLYQFSQVVSQSPEVDEVLRSVLAQARDMLRADTAEISFLSDDVGERAVRIVLGSNGRLQRHGIEDLRHYNQLWTQAVRDEEPLLLPRKARGAKHDFLQQLGYQDAVMAPLRGQAGIVGTLLVGNRQGEVRTFNSTDVRLLETVANHAGVALQNGQLIEQLRHDALHDGLTGLPNRVYLQRVVAEALERVHNNEMPGCAVGLMDLDGFKEVNDTLGHQHGDTLLQHVAGRLSAAAGDVTVARLGGDEFAFLMPDCDSADAPILLARRLLQALHEPFSLDGVDIQVGASLGLALAPDHATDVSALIKRADLAMYDAKNSGIGFCLYETAMDTSDPQRLALAGELRRAIELGQLDVVVQPQATLDTREIIGVEALVRWEHPTLGDVSPDQFVPIAERTGLIRPLTLLVLSRTLAACAQWRTNGIHLPVAVNLSARSLVDLDFVGDVRRLLKRYAVPAQMLTLEITESSVMTDPARAIAMLLELRETGVRLSVDDFGTGYSSLSYLKRLPVQEVKIDRSFVTEMLQANDDAPIVRSIIDLAGNLGLDVVAEGVEDGATWRELQRLGCGRAQGYYLAHPMPLESFATWFVEAERSTLRRPRIGMVHSDTATPAPGCTVEPPVVLSRS